MKNTKKFKNFLESLKGKGQDTLIESVKKGFNICFENENWTVSDTENGKYLGPIEIQDKTGEYHNFEVIDTNDRIVFGGATNTGFIESGYLIKDNDFSLDENLQELVADLEVYYNDGPEYVSRIVTNERM